MEMLVTLLSGLVIVLLLCAMLYATKAIKAQRTGKIEDKKKNLTKAGIFFLGYLLANVIRMMVENNLA